MTDELVPLRVTVAPANTEDDPAESAFRPTVRGRIVDIVWQFPTGANGRVHAVVESRSVQVAPIEGTAVALGGGAPLHFRGLDIPIPDNEPALRLVAWVDAGASLSTTIDVFLVVKPYGVI